MRIKSSVWRICFFRRFEINVTQIVVGPFQENTFVLADGENQSALIFDPGDEADRIADFLQNQQLQPLAILNTHAHIDHIGAVAELQRRFTIPFYLWQAEEPVLAGYPQACAMFGMPAGVAPQVDEWITDEERLSIGSFEVGIIRTPGHTPGGLCYTVNEHVFAGDTLFNGSVGRTDLPGGSWSKLENSLVKLMNKINNEQIIHCGHGPDTSKTGEMQGNPFLAQLRNRIAPNP